MYRHHMIVKEVRGKDTLLVIHYSSDTGDKYDAIVVEQECKVDPKEICVIVYESDHIYTGKDAIARAEGELGTGEGEYHL